MVENGKRKHSPPSSPCLSLPTSTALSNKNKQKIGQTTTKNNGHNDVKKFKRSPDDEIFVDTYESLYNDPVTESMGAHEKFVYNLGLDLALEYSLESFNTMIKEKQEEMNMNNETKSPLDPVIVDSLPFNVENKYEFFNNINKNRSILRKRTKSFHLPLTECLMCNFKTESSLVMDTHLVEPHNMSTLR